jgi:membrane protease YdiL (CAAX protease family)
LWPPDFADCGAFVAQFEHLLIGASQMTESPDPTTAVPDAAVLAPTTPTVPLLDSGCRRPGVELLLVLGLSLGQSAVYSVLSIINKLTLEVPLNQQTTSMNQSITPDRPWLDLAYQVAGVVFPLVPALLALYLLGLGGQRRRIGFDLGRVRFDALRGVGLAAAIGLPGLALLAAAKWLGFNTQIAAANLAAAWWTIPILVAAALMNGLLEEVVMIGYFFTRARDLRWHTAAIVAASALVRGSYHLYQGFGSFVGNAVMGAVFGLFYVKTSRVAPLVVAPTLLDVFAFVGYALLAPYLTWI